MKKLLFTLAVVLSPLVVLSAPSANSILSWDGRNFTSTSSPTVGWLTATSTTATSTFEGNLYVKKNLQVDGKFFAPVTVVSSGNMTVNGTLTTTGNVGVGTNSPAANLHIGETSQYGTASLLLGGAIGGDWYSTISQDTNYGNLSISNTHSWTTDNTTGNIYFKTTPFNAGSGLATRMTINGNGNVGIGTTSPASLLSVAGDTYATGNVYSGTTVMPGAGNIGFGSIGKSVGNLVGGAFQNNSSAGYEGFNYYNENGLIVSSIAHSNGSAGFLPNSTWVGSRTTEPLHLVTNNTAAVTVLGNGNVGIGTTTPSSKLTVYDGNNSYASLFYGGNGDGNTNGVAIGTRSNVGAIQGYDALFSSVQNLTLQPNGGNVGIGTTTPSYKLDVIGTAKFEDNNANGLDFAPGVTNYLRSMGSGGFSIYTAGYATSISLDGSKILLNTSSGGNVGIGTTSPSDMLTLWGNQKYIRINANSEPSTYYARLGQEYNADNALRLYQGTNQVLGTDYSGNRIFLAPTGGNVGIGTTSPAANLSVTGSGYFTNGLGIGALNSTVGTALLQTAAYTSNQLTVNNAVTGATPSIPGGYMPTVTVRTNRTDGSRPLFFGYDNGSGTGWSGFVTTGACGSFSQMCFDMGSASTDYAALISNSNNLAIGGVANATGFEAADGDFANIYFGNTGNILMPNGNLGIGTTSPFANLSVNGNSFVTGTSTTKILKLISDDDNAISVTGISDRMFQDAYMYFYTDHTDPTYGGDFNVNGGDGLGTTAGGSVYLSGGNSESGVGGSITLNGGSGGGGLGQVNMTASAINISGDTKISGGMVLNTDGLTQPTCDSSTRGMLWNVFGDTGVADTFQVCQKSSSDTYSWVTK